VKAQRFTLKYHYHGLLCQQRSCSLSDMSTKTVNKSTDFSSMAALSCHQIKNNTYSHLTVTCEGRVLYQILLALVHAQFQTETQMQSHRCIMHGCMPIIMLSFVLKPGLISTSSIYDCQFGTVAISTPQR
jgi:hypothetical protein